MDEATGFYLSFKKEANIEVPKKKPCILFTQHGPPKMVDEDSKWLAVNVEKEHKLHIFIGQNGL